MSKTIRNKKEAAFEAKKELDLIKKRIEFFSNIVEEDELFSEIMLRDLKIKRVLYSLAKEELDQNEAKKEISTILNRDLEVALRKLILAKKDNSVADEFNIYIKDWAKRLRKQEKKEVVVKIIKNINLKKLEEFEFENDLGKVKSKFKRTEKMLRHLCFFNKY